MNRKVKSILAGVLMALAASAALAGPASASPIWNFEAKELSGSETVVGAAYESALTVPGLTTTCENFLYKLTIKNEAGVGKGSLTEMPLFNCKTDTTACAVKSIAAETLPWPATLTKVSTSNYIKIENVKVGISYSGEECVLGGIVVKVTGTAGGLLDNTTETATFNSASFSATGTVLKAMGSSILWTGVFPTEAFESRRLQPLTVS